MKKTILLTTGLLLLFAAATYTFAQSSNRDYPTQLNSSEITGNMNDHKKESFYSFTAGPGTLTITLDVNANRDEQGVLNFDLLARNGATSLACCYFAQGDGGGTGREVATVVPALSAVDAAIMGRTPGAPMLKLERMTRGADGACLEYVESLLDPARFGLRMEF